MLFAGISFSTFSSIDNDIDTLHSSIQMFASHPVMNLVHLGAMVLFLIMLVGVSALFFLFFRLYNQILGSFIGFGFFAAAISIIISSSAALSFYNLMKDFLITTDYQADMLAIHMLSIHQMKMKALMIGGIFFGLSMFFLSVLAIHSKIIPLFINIITGISGISLIYATWLSNNILITKGLVGFAIIMMVVNGFFLIQHSKSISK